MKKARLVRADTMIRNNINGRNNKRRTEQTNPERTREVGE